MHTWDYAELSTAAKAAGGPENYTESLITTGRNEMVPWIPVAAVGAFLLALGTVQIVSHIKSKRAATQPEKKLIQEADGIKKTDTPYANSQEA